MAALVQALDTATQTQIGEKGHTEYAWSSDIKERITQFSFQLTRTDSSKIKELSIVLDSLLKNIVGAPDEEQDKRQEYLIMLYKMIGHTRDIISGKGEYMLAYMQIVVWHRFFPELAVFALNKFVTIEDDTHPYGSWKDIKYFCVYCRDEENLPKGHPLIRYALQLTVDQLRKDSSAEKKTLVGKWVARESSKKFGWIFNELAYLYFAEILSTGKTEDQIYKAKSKCRMLFRKVITSHNKSLDTIQIKQCKNIWTEIDHNKTTSITLAKQKKALLNVTKTGEVRSQREDRIQCAEKFTEFIAAGVRGEVKIKGRNVGMASFVISAIDLLNGVVSESNQTEIDLLNQQWLDNSSYTGALGNIIPMVDNSGSMFQGTDAGYAAIALGIRCAEKSLLGKRVMVFNENATWLNLDGHDTFFEMVKSVYKVGGWGISTNFYAAMNQILNAIKTASPPIPFAKATSFVLAIFSDMQMDTADNTNMDTLYNTMVQLFAEAGQEIYGKPLKPPHILFWNMSSSNGFPSLSSAKNASMLSGWSPALLNLFCEKGMEALESMTPWSQLQDMLHNERYDCLELAFRSQVV